MRWRYIHEEEIKQRYNWPQATPCSQLEWRMHTGWRASFPISLWGRGREGRRHFTSREVVSLAEANTACAAHVRLFVTQACSLQADHSRESLQLSKIPSKRTGKRLLSWSHTLVPGTKPESNGWAQQWLLVSLWWGTDFHFFRLQTGEMKPVLTQLPPATLPTVQLLRTWATYSTGLCCWLFSISIAWL